MGINLHVITQEHPAATHVIDVGQTRLRINILTTENRESMPEESSDEARIGNPPSPVMRRIFLRPEGENGSNFTPSAINGLLKPTFPHTFTKLSFNTSLLFIRNQLEIV
jgi:hypothetical protein